MGLLAFQPRNPPAASGLSIISSGALINTTTNTTTPAILTSVTMQAGDVLVIPLGVTRDTSGVTITASGTWNGEAMTESAVLRHAGGRIAGHFLTLVAASSGTFTPAITLSHNSNGTAANYYVFRGQDVSPIKQTASNSANTVSTISTTVTAPGANRYIVGFGVQQYGSTANPTTLTVSAPLTILGSSVRTGTSNNLDCLFASGDYLTPNTSNVTVQVNSNAATNFLVMAMEIG